MYITGPNPKQFKPWWLHVLAIAIGILAYSCSFWFGYAWGASIGAATASLIFPALIYYRKFGKRERFWMIVSLLSIVQIPLVIAVRPLVEQFRFVFILMFGAADCLFVAFAITRMCSEE